MNIDTIYIGDGEWMSMLWHSMMRPITPSPITFSTLRAYLHHQLSTAPTASWSPKVHTLEYIHPATEEYSGAVRTA